MNNFWKSCNKHLIKKFLDEQESTFNSTVWVVTSQGCIYTEKKNINLKKKHSIIFWQKLKKKILILKENVRETKQLRHMMQGMWVR